MAKSSSNNSTSKLDDTGWSGGEEKVTELAKVLPNLGVSAQVSFDSESNVNYTNNGESNVCLRSLFDGRLEYTGQVSGKQYVWDKAGSTVEVAYEDAPHLLAKRVGRQPCCGDSRDGTAILSKIN